MLGAILKLNELQKKVIIDRFVCQLTLFLPATGPATGFGGSLQIYTIIAENYVR